jgi:hypothetical protein
VSSSLKTDATTTFLRNLVIFLESDRPVSTNAWLNKENDDFTPRNFDFDKENAHFNQDNYHFVLRNARFN